jgi:uncharacterized protein YndB with AHSA1/START domain
MSRGSADVVRRQFAAFRKGLDAVAEFWHPGIEWRAVEGAADDVGVITGHEALRRYYEGWLESFDDLHAEVEEVIFESDERCAAAIRNLGRPRGTSAVVRGRYYVVCTVRDSRIVSGREYESEAEALEAVSATRLTRHIRAPRGRVYRALLDPEAVQQWMVPEGMTSHVHSLDAREGGTFRISLTYDTPTSAGKSAPQTDSFRGWFVRLVPDSEVVQVVGFETDDPTMTGEMTITYTLADADEGTNLTAVHENLPRGLSPSDNELGWRMSIEKLARLVEGV